LHAPPPLRPRRVLPRSGDTAAGNTLRPNNGYTLIEILIVIAIIGVLSAIAVPNYQGYRYKAQVVVAISEMKMMEKAILNFAVEQGRFPDSLNDVGLSQMADPWERPYRYLRIDGNSTPGVNGDRRRDKQANPVNTDFDLYSMGRDGGTAPRFDAQKARDDVVRANDGAYFGLAEDH
jgi:general secretion pathway protein G